jgi:hypothetical protein
VLKDPLANAQVPGKVAVTIEQSPVESQREHDPPDQENEIKDGGLSGESGLAW